MRQVHRAGEKTFIDFSGKRPTLVDRRTGELRRVELFVAVLGASSLTYAEATQTQQSPGDPTTASSSRLIRWTGQPPSSTTAGLTQMRRGIGGDRAGGHRTRNPPFAPN